MTFYLKRKYDIDVAGVDTNEPLRIDPLLVHYRGDNIRLENVKEQLEEKIRDLEATLMEQDLYEEPCDGARVLREKMRALREQFRYDKKRYLLNLNLFKNETR